MSTEKTTIAQRKLKKITTSRLTDMKARGERISMLTAYDYSFARILDEAGVDILLVGDSASNVIHGHETTVPITLDQMIDSWLLAPSSYEDRKPLIALLENREQLTIIGDKGYVSQELDDRV